MYFLKSFFCSVWDSIDQSHIFAARPEVIKKYSGRGLKIAEYLYGMENQTKIEKYMPFRLFSYDGAAYRSQLLNQRKKVVPVITIVLYFGMDHWRAPKNVKELLDIPEGLDGYVNDYNIHVFDFEI